LQSDQEIDSRRLLRELQLCLTSAQELDQLVTNNLDDLLPGSEGFYDFLAQCALFHSLDEILRDLEVNIGIKESIPDLPARLFEVPFGHAALATKVPENFLQLVGQIL
jgi:hypothetical protein